MSKSNCTVCGLHKEACLHQQELKEARNDRRVTRMLWFAIGFITSLVAMFLTV